jgi:Na+/H+-dicarboxylate symporter
MTYYIILGIAAYSFMKGLDFIVKKFTPDGSSIIFDCLKWIVSFCLMIFFGILAIISAVYAFVIIGSLLIYLIASLLGQNEIGSKTLDTMMFFLTFGA